MKIILKNNYTNNIKKFNNKTELIYYIRNYLEWKLGIIVCETDSIKELVDTYFGDYKIVN